MAYLYHGTPIGGLKILRPYPSVLQEGRSVLFAGKRWVAISYVQKWSDEDFLQGMSNGKPYLKEVYSGAFDKIFHKGGYLYTVKNTHFKRDDRIFGYEYYSEQAVRPINEEFINNPVKELEKLNVLIIPFEDHKTVFDWGKTIDKKLLYHLSRNDQLTELTPATSKAIIDNPNSWENDTIPRICFSKTVRGAILGLQLKESDFKNNSYLIFYVYSPIRLTQSILIDNEELVNKRLVFDAHITDEVWITRPIEVKKLYKIKIYSPKVFNETIEFKPLIVKDERYLNSDGLLTTYALKYTVLEKY